MDSQKVTPVHHTLKFNSQRRLATLNVLSGNAPACGSRRPFRPHDLDGELHDGFDPLEVLCDGFLFEKREGNPNLRARVDIARQGHELTCSRYHSLLSF